jgi:microcystin-dependent protein
MDRKMIYPGQIPLETDLLDTNRFALIGLGKLAAAVLGTTTLVNGLACTPTAPASMQVQVAAGEIYSLQNLNGAAYSSLAADTTHSLLKQGLLMDAVNLTCPAPATSGQSVNYLVQAIYQDIDAQPLTLPYYNASNPTQAYSGPAGSGTAQNTVRKGVCTVSVKAGIAATTGSQQTPAPDVGYVGLYSVTVAYGQTTIAAGNIATVSGAPILSETLLQKISVATGDARYALLSSQGANAQTQPYTAFTTTGVTGAFVLTPSPAIAAYAANQRFRVKFHAVGNGSDTLAVSGLTAKNLKQYGPTGAKVAAVIVTNQLADIEYDGADFVILDPLPTINLPAGSVIFAAQSTAPSGYLKANGSAISRTTYATLFAAIGTTFGAGDGSTTFNVPDLRGEFLRGFDDGRGADSGRTFGSTQKGSMNVFDDDVGGYGVYALEGNTSGSPNANAGLDTVTAGYSASSYPGLSLGYAGATTNAYTMSGWLSSVAANSVGAGMTRPRNVALLACIKY